MAREVARGDIWLYEFGRPDKRRPVLVLSRPALLEVLETATVVAITSTRRGSPTEVALDVDEGLKGPSCANLVNVFTVPKRSLRRYIGRVSPEKMADVCLALAVAVGCQ